MSEAEDYATSNDGEKGLYWVLFTMYTSCFSKQKGSVYQRVLRMSVGHEFCTGDTPDLLRFFRYVQISCDETATSLKGSALVS